ncbi:ComF family protein [Naumannella halotolerans]|uniref:Putative amidophosphoribosyltransferase n=1 Tax=Naumannella halotolerans TaxID=993414 RepID=A0A4R7J8D8_9ACTN|nr:ComF family protein [Naumannella halotolerans]TDT33750.1 putative amidophosphoribosyltransferase [Naumannella halotolerans]
MTGSDRPPDGPPAGSAFGIATAVRHGLELAADLLLGARCCACSRPAIGLCMPCLGAVRAEVPHPVVPRPAPPGWPLCVGAGTYRGPAARAVVAYKDRGALTLAPVLGGRLALAVAELLVRADGWDPAVGVALVPMPSARAAVRRRGLDATTVLARQAAARLRRVSGMRHRQVGVRRLLRQRSGVVDQSGLSSSQRVANLRGALRTRSSPTALEPGLIVVDDVVTTGASIAEAVATLRRAGWPVIGAATVTATQKVGCSGA